MKTEKVECSNMGCYQGTVEVRGSRTPEGEVATEICRICEGTGFVEVPVAVDKPAKPE